MKTKHVFIEGLWGVGKSTLKSKLPELGYSMVSEPDHTVADSVTLEGDELFFSWYKAAFAQKLLNHACMPGNYAFERSFASTLAFYEAMTGKSHDYLTKMHLDENEWSHYRSADAQCLLLNFSPEGYQRTRAPYLEDRQMRLFLEENPHLIFSYQTILHDYCNLLFGENDVLEIQVGSDDGFFSKEDILSQVSKVLEQKN